MVDQPTTQYEQGSAPYTESPLSVDKVGGAYEEHPELFVGAAFVGGFVVAQILKKVGE